MKGKAFEYDNFVVYPEYCDYTELQLASRSLEDDKYHIAAIPRNVRNETVVFHKGKLLYSRAKCRLHSSEVGVWEEGKTKPEIVNLDGRSVLILNCYELVFPEDYLKQERDVDLVVHMIGQPMFDENQREGWVALQKCLSLLHNCPVICCCGGKQGRMNISGVVNSNKER